MAETKPIEGDALDLAIAERIRRRDGKAATNATETKNIERRTAEIGAIEAELTLMRAARAAGTPYAPATNPPTSPNNPA